jgi:hypothetical protein
MTSLNYLKFNASIDEAMFARSDGQARQIEPIENKLDYEVDWPEADETWPEMDLESLLYEMSTEANLFC